MAILRLYQRAPGHPIAIQFTDVYHNLLRRWADA
ncbi:MAG: hypothetical protein IBJ03_10860 [Gemmatimonadaceae bacterium]|nr:hypothetical protein [Gemmatimonadaceae bacterium]